MAETSKQKGGKKRYRLCAARSLPAITGSLAAILTEGKSIREMETMAIFLSNLANDIFFIASVCNKNRDLIIDDLSEL